MHDILITCLAMTCIEQEGKCPVVYGRYTEVPGCFGCPFDSACFVEGHKGQDILERRRLNRIELANKVLRVNKLEEILK